MRTERTEILSCQGVDSASLVFCKCVGVVGTCSKASANCGAIGVGGASLSGCIALARLLLGLSCARITGSLLIGGRSLTG